MPTEQGRDAPPTETERHGALEAGDVAVDASRSPTAEDHVLCGGDRLASPGIRARCCQHSTELSPHFIEDACNPTVLRTDPRRTEPQRFLVPVSGVSQRVEGG